MTATEELRRLLDERGVEWWPMHDIENGYHEDRDTKFLVWGCKHVAHEWGCRLQVDMLTPEQAIEATLGRGTCRRVLYKPTGVLVCSECGAGIPKQLDKYCYLHYCPNCGAKVVS